MKKNIIIIAAFCLSIVGCSKVGLAPETQTLSTDKTETETITKKEKPTPTPAAKGGGEGIAIDPVSQCYTITNTEKAEGFAEYKFSYVGEKGAVQTVSLALGQSISFSATSATVKANFQYFLIEGGGNCGPRRSTLPPGPCDYYTIKNPFGKDGQRVWYEYTDCEGHSTKGELNPLGLIVVSAVPGTINCPNGVVLPMR